MNKIGTTKYLDFVTVGLAFHTKNVTLGTECVLGEGWVVAAAAAAAGVGDECGAPSTCHLVASHQLLTAEAAVAVAIYLSTHNPYPYYNSHCCS